MSSEQIEELYMKAALVEAERAGTKDEVPVGAVVVLNGEIVGRGGNSSLHDHDPTAHAEMVAMREAAVTIGNYRLTDALLVSTMEPCLMCLGAATHARIGRVVYGAEDPAVGAGRLFARGELPVNHRFEVTGGILENECAEVMTAWFRRKREPHRNGAART